MSVCLWVCVSVHALWKDDRSDPDALWHVRSNGSMYEAGSKVWGSVNGKGYILGANMGSPIVTNGDFYY